MIKKKFNITVTDITKLPLKTKLADGKKETRYAVIWQLDDAEMSEEDNYEDDSYDKDIDDSDLVDDDYSDLSIVDEEELDSDN